MALAMELADLKTDIVEAVEIAPPQCVGDDGIVALAAQYELLLFERFTDGTLLVTPPPGFFSGLRNAELTGQVRDWVRTGDRGSVGDSSCGFNLPDGSLFAPDTTFIARGRTIAAETDRSFPVLVPDAVFELLSKSDRVRTTMRKIRAYLRNGVGLVVLIDPYRRHVYVGHAGDEAARDLGEIDHLDCSPAMPGFVLDVAAIRNAK